MPYEQSGSFSDLGDVDPYLRELAAAGGETMESVAVKNTPVESGRLRASWYRQPVNRTIRRGVRSYESVVATDVSYAPYVEFGTGLWGPKHSYYTITPKHRTWLSWLDPKSGHRFYRRMVRHPGSPGNHMIEIAASVAEHEWKGVAEPILQGWARDVEANVR